LLFERRSPDPIATSMDEAPRRPRRRSRGEAHPNRSEELIMKKLLLLGLAAFALVSIVTPISANAIDLGNLLPKEGGGAPEIDPSSIGSAIALVMGGLAMLGDRIRR
jgi:hypothetical protein